MPADNRVRNWMKSVTVVRKISRFAHFRPQPCHFMPHFRHGPQRVTGCDRVRPGATECDRVRQVRPGTTECDRCNRVRQMRPGATGCDRCDRVRQGATERDRVRPGAQTCITASGGDSADLGRFLTITQTETRIQGATRRCSACRGSGRRPLRRDGQGGCPAQLQGRR